MRAREIMNTLRGLSARLLAWVRGRFAGLGGAGERRALTAAPSGSASVVAAAPSGSGASVVASVVGSTPAIPPAPALADPSLAVTLEDELSAGPEVASAPALAAARARGPAMSSSASPSESLSEAPFEASAEASSETPSESLSGASPEASSSRSLLSSMSMSMSSPSRAPLSSASASSASSASSAAPARPRPLRGPAGAAPAIGALEPGIGAAVVRRYFTRVGAREPLDLGAGGWRGISVERFFVALTQPRPTPSRAAMEVVREEPRVLAEAFADFVWD